MALESGGSCNGFGDRYGPNKQNWKFFLGIITNLARKLYGFRLINGFKLREFETFIWIEKFE